MRVSEAALGLLIGMALSAAMLYALVRLVMAPILCMMVAAQ